MKEITPSIYQFPEQLFFGETVSVYAIDQPEAIFCFDIPRNTPQNIEFLCRKKKAIRIIMSHGSTANGFETTREDLVRQGASDVQIWLHEGDRHNQWLTIMPDVLFKDEGRKLSKDLTLIHTPGHTRGSVCLHSSIGKGIIFSGDTLGGMTDGTIRPFELKDNELDKGIFFRSLRKLLAYQFEYILPFHYAPITFAKGRLRDYINKYNDL